MSPTTTSVPTRPETDHEGLAALLTDLAAHRARWEPDVRFDPRHRTYTQLVDREDVSVWLICWMPGHDTGFHDHDGVGGVLRVVRGSVAEERPTLLGEPIRRVLAEGDVATFHGDDIHRVVHAGSEPAVTIHAYAPALRGMGAYDSGPGGSLRRRSLAPGTELRPPIRARDLVLAASPTLTPAPR